MKITPLEFNCIQVGLDHLIECLEEGKEDREDEIKLEACRSIKAKFNELQKAIESEGGFSSAEIHLNE